MTRIGQNGRSVLYKSDEAAFRELVEPVIPTMLRMARHELTFYLRQRLLDPRDLRPESVVGEALVHSWQRRGECPKDVSLRGWLLGMQHRVLRDMVERQRQYREDKAISLDETPPLESADSASEDSQEWFRDWYEADGEISWDDVTPGTTLEEVELSLEQFLDGPEDEEEEAERALMMHEGYRMAMPEVAFTMDRSVQDIADLLAKARASNRWRGAMQTGIRETDEPTPPSAAES